MVKAFSDHKLLGTYNTLSEALDTTNDISVDISFIDIELTSNEIVRLFKNMYGDFEVLKVIPKNDTL